MHHKWICTEYFWTPVNEAFCTIVAWSLDYMLDYILFLKQVLNKQRSNISL